LYTEAPKYYSVPSYYTEAPTYYTTKAAEYRTEPPKYYTNKAPEYYTTTCASSTHYTEALKYNSAPSYTITTEAAKYYAAPTNYTAATPLYYVEPEYYTEAPLLHHNLRYTYYPLHRGPMYYTTKAPEDFNTIITLLRPTAPHYTNYTLLPLITVTFLNTRVEFSILVIKICRSYFNNY
jgi:hypothetical protein